MKRRPADVVLDLWRRPFVWTEVYSRGRCVGLTSCGCVRCDAAWRARSVASLFTGLFALAFFILLGMFSFLGNPGMDKAKMVGGMLLAAANDKLKKV